MNLEFHNGAQNPFEVGPKYMPMQFNEIFSTKLLSFVHVWEIARE